MSDDAMRSRRHWLQRDLALAGLFAGASRAVMAAGPATGSYDSSARIDPGQGTTPVNRLLLGANVQWVDHGDEQLTPGTLQFLGPMLDGMKALGPTVLRYPGGSMADTYRWQSGLGELKERGSSQHFYSRQMQTVEMGSREFLELCEAVGAIPLITVNVATGSADDAAGWVRQLNSTGIRSRQTGKIMPPVKYWEVGNEPYLKDASRPDLWMNPAEYLRRANAIAAAMRQADPTIQIGLPIRNDTLGTMPFTPFKGFASTVLQGFTGKIDFLSLHDGYMPYGVDRSYTDEEFYWAAMNGAMVTAADLAATRTLVGQLRKESNMRLALTEYNAMFTLTGDKAPTDAYIETLAGSLFVADLLCMLARQPDILMSIYHSLSGNWHFGLVSNAGVRRPAYFLLQAFGRMLRGRLTPITITAATYDTAKRVGVVPPYTGQPLLTGLAAVDGTTVRAVVINKDLRRATTLTLNVLGVAAGTPVKYNVLTGNGAFDVNYADTPTTMVTGKTTFATAGTVKFSLPPHCVAFLEIPRG